MPHRIPAILLTSLLVVTSPAYAAYHPTATTFSQPTPLAGNLPVNAITHKAILQARLRTAARPLLTRAEARHALLLVIINLLAPAFKPVVHHLLPVAFR